MVDERASQKNKLFFKVWLAFEVDEMYVSHIVDKDVLCFNFPVVERRLRGHRGQDQGVRRIFQHQDGAEGRHRHRRGRPRQADGASRDGERRGQFHSFRITRLGDFWPVALLLEAHYDF
jgi:hypothetical protein